MRWLHACWIVLFAGGQVATAQDRAPAPPLQIFILAGQSNMEGKGSVQTMRHQLSLPEKRARFERFARGDQWIEREDVWISYLGGQGRRQGKLTVGYGTSKPDTFEIFGPELGFGWTVGDALDEDVLIIKTAWGGKSLDRDFRPPSRGYPPSLDEQFEQAQKRNENLTLDEFKESYGHFYRLMIDEVRQVTGDLAAIVPGYRDQGYQLAGFVWFQGWNDQYAPTSVEDYADNLAAFIEDVRRDLNAPDLPFVIGAMGHDGANQTGKIRQIAEAQLAVAQRPEFDGRVITVETALYWDLEAEEAYAKYWKDESRRDIEKWREYGNDHGYHYFGSPVFFCDAGVAFGEAMLRWIGEHATSIRSAGELDAKSIGEIVGVQATTTPDGVVRVGWARTDASVEIDGLAFRPFAGLGSWAAFQSTEDAAMLMGDTVVFEDEVNPAIDAALAAGLEITALHNHFFFDQPKVYFMHIGGMGAPDALANGVRKTWDAIKAVRAKEPNPQTSFPGPVPTFGELAGDRLSEIIGSPGESKDGVYKIVIGRTGNMHGVPFGGSMGLTTWMAFSGSDEYAAVCGDFAMTPGEVQPVLRALRAAGIQIVALHNHMIGDEPNFLFVHFWGKGPAAELARGLRQTLDAQEQATTKQAAPMKRHAK